MNKLICHATALFLCLGHVSSCLARGSGDQQKPSIEVKLGIVAKKDVYHRADALSFAIAIKNTSAAELAVCVDDWAQPLGLIKLIVEDATGRRIVERGGLERYREIGRAHV